MTTPSGNIVFNTTSTNGDTQASGLGPATAVFGTGASLNATTTVDLSADTPDLSGVSAGDLLWVSTTSGRQYAIIASVDDVADTVTVDDAFGVTESSRTWAIGGKRATIGETNSQLMFADAHDDWTIELEDDQSISAAITWSGGDNDDRGFRLIGTAGSIKTITQTASATAHFSLSSASSTIENIKFLNSGATKEYVVLGGSGALTARFIDCVAGEGSGGNNPQGFGKRGAGGMGMSAINCIADYCGEDGFGEISTRNRVVGVNSKAIGCGRHGFATRGDGGLVLHNCIADSNGGDGFYSGSQPKHVHVTNCVSRNNTGDGFNSNAAETTDQAVIILNNQFTENGAYGVDFGSWAATSKGFFADGNNFGTGGTANTSGDYNGNISGGSRDTAVDPAYTDTANGDYTPGTTAQFTAGFPEFTIDTTTVSANQPIGVVGGSGTGGGATNVAAAKFTRLE